LKVLITGASSLPGFRTTEKALERGHRVVAAHLRNPVPIQHQNLQKIKLDITNLQDLKKLLHKESPDVVVHMAALGDVDSCERDRDLAWNTMVEPSITIANWASKTHAFLVYLSSDYVFDGETGHYAEHDPPNPINYYGLVKLAGEVAFRSSTEDCAVLRASSIYGLGPGRKNFAKYLIERLKRGEEVKALADQYTTPTQAQLLGEAVVEVIERKLTGIFHITGERMSRYQFGLKVAQLLRFDERLVKEAKMKDMKWFARRPRDSSLDSKRSRAALKADFYNRAFKVLEEEYSKGEQI
jgi:dTDP-4-dehydrorhamnose reductase